MARKQPVIVPVHSIKSLFWQQFPYSVEIDFSILVKTTSQYRADRWSQGRQIAHSKIGDNIAKMLPTDKKVFRRVRSYYQWKMYFLNESDYQAFILGMNTFKKDVVITNLWQPDDAAHLALLKTDHKLVTRKTLFFDSYTWKITFVPGYKMDKDELNGWVEEMFGEDGMQSKGKYSNKWITERFQFDERNHIPVLYLKDEDDVVITKLIYSSSIKKIEKAIILDNQNNNNNKGIFDEPSTVSQIG